MIKFPYSRSSYFISYIYVHIVIYSYVQNYIQQCCIIPKCQLASYIVIYSNPSFLKVQLYQINNHMKD